ncbi:MAG: hypothetical protein JSS20_17510, partial [Proteobacteria bacterium]|nr:hypothetical protein [Pseudomonadota bacterium]
MDHAMNNALNQKGDEAGIRGAVERIGCWIVFFTIFSAAFVLFCVGCAWLAQDANMMTTPGYRYFPWSLVYTVLGSIVAGAVW